MTDPHRPRQRRRLEPRPIRDQRRVNIRPPIAPLRILEPHRARRLLHPHMTIRIHPLPSRLRAGRQHLHRHPRRPSRHRRRRPIRPQQTTRHHQTRRPHHQILHRLRRLTRRRSRRAPFAGAAHPGNTDPVASTATDTTPTKPRRSHHETTIPGSFYQHTKHTGLAAGTRPTRDTQAAFNTPPGSPPPPPKQNLGNRSEIETRATRTAPRNIRRPQTSRRLSAPTTPSPKTSKPSMTATGSPALTTPRPHAPRPTRTMTRQTPKNLDRGATSAPAHPHHPSKRRRLSNTRNRVGDGTARS